MRIGIDFDNTLVRYDDLFHRLALNKGLIPPSIPPNKQAIRNHLRQFGQEGQWTELQGVAYGPSIHEAEAFPDSLAVIRKLHEAGADLYIISHKTRTPYRGLKYDLHGAALNWLTSRAFLDEESTGLSHRHVFFEPSIEAKLKRIATCRCSYFIDDLPEFLSEPNFPPETKRIWFNPERAPNNYRLEIAVNSWLDVDAVLSSPQARGS